MLNSESWARIFAPLPLQRPQKQKMSKTNCDGHRSALGLPSFLILVCGNDFTRPTEDINVNCPLYTKRPPETKTSTKIFVICHFSFGDYSEAPSSSFMRSDRRSYMKRGGCSAICRLSGRITVKLVGFRKRMAPSRQCNGTTVEDSPLRGVMNVVLQLRNSGSGTRPNESRAARD